VTVIFPRNTEGPPAEIGGPFLLTCRTCYFFSGIAIGAVVVAVDVTVEVTADCGAGFGASCFWHPAKAKIAETARAAMIAVIFFMCGHPLSSHLNDCRAFVAIE
jgi:hypothetical protein